MAFLKSTWFRCITVLLAIALIAGGLLAVLNDVLFVTPAERTERAMAKIYGQAKEITKVYLDIDADTNDEANKNALTTAIENDYGTITKIYVIGDIASGNYDLVYQSTGKDGYKGGTITLWVKAVVENDSIANAKLDKVVLESYDKQTLMGKFDAMYYEQFVKLYQSGKLFTANKKETDKVQNIIAGATKSSNASCNAINCVIENLKILNLGGGANEN